MADVRPMISEAFHVEGLSELPQTESALVRSRISMAIRDVPRPAGGLDLRVCTGDADRGAPHRSPSGTVKPPHEPRKGPTGSHGRAGGQNGESEPTVEERAAQYASVAPRHRFHQLVIPATVREDLQAAVALLRVSKLVFGDWGLQEIESSPRTALNFHGPPGVDFPRFR